MTFKLKVQVGHKEQHFHESSTVLKGLLESRGTVESPSSNENLAEQNESWPSSYTPIVLPQVAEVPSNQHCCELVIPSNSAFCTRLL